MRQNRRDKCRGGGGPSWKFLYRSLCNCSRCVKRRIDWENFLQSRKLPDQPKLIMSRTRAARDQTPPIQKG
jgi:hypothetical protein